jgi:hypothetical protein
MLYTPLYNHGIIFEIFFKSLHSGKRLPGVAVEKTDAVKQSVEAARFPRTKHYSSVTYSKG